MAGLGSKPVAADGQQANLPLSLLWNRWFTSHLSSPNWLLQVSCSTAWQG